MKAKITTRSGKPATCLTRRTVISLTGLVVLSLITALPGATRSSLASARTQDASAPNPGQARSQEPGRPVTPLEKLLNNDGTLSLNTGFSGSLDPTGWQMTTPSWASPNSFCGSCPEGQPRFVRTGVAKEQKQARNGIPSRYSRQALSAAEGPKLQPRSAPGDENWDDSFYLPGVDYVVSAVAIGGSNVHIGGSFTLASRLTVNHVAPWDGSQWYAVGSGVNGDIRAIAISGNDVYVGGLFDRAGGIIVNGVARWDGSQWHPLGSGVANSGASGGVRALAISGSNVYLVVESRRSKVESQDRWTLDF